MHQGNQISDIDEYFARPDVQQQRAFPRDATPAAKTPAPHPNEPILLGTTTTSDPISELNHLCQLRGAATAWTFEEVSAGRFTGSVTVLGQTLPRPGEAFGTFSSKKSVKEALAEQALELLNTQPVNNVMGPHEGINWIGKLQGR
jgi:hypothetical protein